MGWALSHLSTAPHLSETPGSDNVLCFPTHQNTDSERTREQKDCPMTFTLLVFIWSLVCEPGSELRNANKRTWLPREAQTRSPHETSQKAFLNHILSTEREGTIQPVPQKTIWNLHIKVTTGTCPKEQSCVSTKTWLTYVMDV